MTSRGGCEGTTIPATRKHHHAAGYGLLVRQHPQTLPVKRHVIRERGVSTLAACPKCLSTHSRVGERSFTAWLPRCLYFIGPCTSSQGIRLLEIMLSRPALASRDTSPLNGRHPRPRYPPLNSLEAVQFTPHQNRPQEFSLYGQERYKGAPPAKTPSVIPEPPHHHNSRAAAGPRCTRGGAGDGELVMGREGGSPRWGS